ncbi:MAG TPA: protein-disulfide reductase DsbD domain-containing protein [Fimbriimonadaceae bacterium]|nr:protein-disulfide reductase DsbD domain-containing protein [Fimbriimonadaceae bacterium]
MHRFISRSLVLGLASCVALAATAAGPEPKVGISGSAPKTVKHGGKLVASVKFAVPAGFHIYSPTFKGVGIPVSFELQGAPKGFKVGAVKAPAGGELKGNVPMQVTISVPATAKGKESITLVVHYQQCNDRICLPPDRATVSLSTVVK